MLSLSKQRGTAWSRALQLFLIALVAFVLWKGVVPAFSTIETDFPNYFTAGRIVLKGERIDRLYDDEWFQRQITEAGINRQGKFSPFPPATALFSVPLALFTPMTAMRLLTLLNLFLLSCSILLVARISGFSFTGSCLLALLSGVGLVNCLRFGQVYVVLSALILLAYFLFLRGRPFLAGICLGIFIPVKYYPAILLIPFLLEKNWRVPLAAACTGLAVTGLTILVLGWEIHKEYFASVLGNHLSARLSMQDPFSATFQSWDSLFLRGFVRDDHLNPHPLVDLPGVYAISRWGIPALGGAATIAALYWLRNASRTVRMELSVAVLGLGALAFAPATATYHMVLLWLPLLLLLKTLGETGRPGLGWLALGFYAVMGFIPYSLALTWEGTGVTGLLAYPRLFLVNSLFATAVFASLTTSGLHNAALDK